MTIEKGEPWGVSGTRPSVPVERAASDAELASLVGRLREQNPTTRESDPSQVTAAVDAGDLLKTLGAEPPTFAGEQRVRAVGGGGEEGVMKFPMDLGLVSIDGKQSLGFVASVIVRSRLWSGEGAAIMNAAWWGAYYLGPRSHPNDGLLDITLGRLPLRQLLEARRRAKTGSHLPHPGLEVVRVCQWQHEFSHPTPITIDGIAHGKVRTIRVEVVPDAFTLIV